MHSCYPAQGKWHAALMCVSELRDWVPRRTPTGRKSFRRAGAGSAMADAMTSAILYRVCVHTPEWAVQSSPRSNVRSGIAAAAASSPKEGTNSKSSVWCCSRRRRQPSPPVASEDTPSSSDAAWQLAADPNRKRVFLPDVGSPPRRRGRFCLCFYVVCASCV